MNTNTSVILIMGSIRAGRVCPTIANWIAQMGRAVTDLSFEIIDLANWALPMDDEPAIPATGLYTHAHTRAWSEKVLGAGGIIILSPQYNWGYPAVLKNAIDHVYREWHGKHTAIITYGGHGGMKCAEQLKQIAEAIKLRLVPTAPALVLPERVIREGAALEPDQDFSQHAAAVKSALVELRAAIT